MSTARWFSTFDLRSSYHQVIVEPKDRDKTAFICPRGMYRYKTMPFGLCNAGATFQRLMDIVMSGLHLEVYLIYLDDIIIFSSTVDEHLERLVRVLDRLHTAGLKLKPENVLSSRNQCRSWATSSQKKVLQLTQQRRKLSLTGLHQRL